jgi:hypothetical protein
VEGDPLADILTLASARCVRIGTLRAGGTWALRFPPPQKIKLTAVVTGGCWLAVDGERAPLRLETGDVFMVPAERSYLLASDVTASQLDGLALFAKAASRESDRARTSSPSADTWPWILTAGACSPTCCRR